MPNAEALKQKVWLFPLLRDLCISLKERTKPIQQVHGSDSASSPRLWGNRARESERGSLCTVNPREAAAMHLHMSPPLFSCFFPVFTAMPCDVRSSQCEKMHAYLHPSTHNAMCSSAVVQTLSFRWCSNGGCVWIIVEPREVTSCFLLLPPERHLSSSSFLFCFTLFTQSKTQS